MPILGRIDRVGVLGTGVQARYQMQFVQHVVKCRSMGVYGRSHQKMKELQSEMVEHGWKNVALYSTADEVLKECDIVITTTSARSPVLGNTIDTSKDKLKCRLVICIGADAPGKTEISSKLLDCAGLLVADSVQQSLERGEFQHLQNSAKKKTICSLGGLIKDSTGILAGLNKQKDNPLIVFDSSGVALQDCVIATLVYNALTNVR